MIGGIAVAAGAAWYFMKGKGMLPTAQVTAPTYKLTADSTLMEMEADLKGWVERNDPGWGGQQSKIYAAVMNEGSAAIKNIHALLWDIWQPGKIDNYPFKVNSSLQPVAWANSVGSWWDLFKKRNGII